MAYLASNPLEIVKSNAAQLAYENIDINWRSPAFRKPNN